VLWWLFSLRTRLNNGTAGPSGKLLDH